MTPTVSISPVRKSIIVRADPALAFEIFTNGIDSWWPKSHSMGGTPFKQSVIEPFVGGRWYAERHDGSEVNIGHVVVWEPSRRVVFRWEVGPGFKPDPEQSTELEVKFVSLGSGSTRVELSLNTGTLTGFATRPVTHIAMGSIAAGLWRWTTTPGNADAGSRPGHQNKIWSCYTDMADPGGEKSGTPSASPPCRGAAPQDGRIDVGISARPS